jgi:hypothetical protein
MPASVDELLGDPPVTAFRDVVVIGGGCYGTFYAGQLETALRRGKIMARSIVMVDRDPRCQLARERAVDPPLHLAVSEWGSYLDALLDRPAPIEREPDDAIVPSPLMPHLMAEWLTRLARREAPERSVTVVPVDGALGTPYDTLAPDGTRYVSFADWLCPTHCVEPHVCPVTRGPRTWEMADALTGFVARRSRARATLGPALFVTRHRAFGVGMFDVAEARMARASLAEALGQPGESELVIATISSCHGAITCLRIGAGAGVP